MSNRFYETYWPWIDSEERVFSGSVYRKMQERLYDEYGETRMKQVAKFIKENEAVIEDDFRIKKSPWRSLIMQGFVAKAMGKLEQENKKLTVKNIIDCVKSFIIESFEKNRKREEEKEHKNKLIKQLVEENKHKFKIKDDARDRSEIVNRVRFAIDSLIGKNKILKKNKQITYEDIIADKVMVGHIIDFVNFEIEESKKTELNKFLQFLEGKDNAEEGTTRKKIIEHKEGNVNKNMDNRIVNKSEGFAEWLQLVSYVLHALGIKDDYKDTFYRSQIEELIRKALSSKKKKVKDIINNKNDVEDITNEVRSLWEKSKGKEILDAEEYKPYAEMFVDIYKEDIQKKTDIKIGSVLSKEGAIIDHDTRKIIGLVAKAIKDLKKNDEQLAMRDIFTNKTIVKDIIDDVNAELVKMNKKEKDKTSGFYRGKIKVKKYEPNKWLYNNAEDTIE